MHDLSSLQPAQRGTVALQEADDNVRVQEEFTTHRRSPVRSPLRLPWPSASGHRAGLCRRPAVTVCPVPLPVPGLPEPWRNPARGAGALGVTLATVPGLVRQLFRSLFRLLA